jgi:cysteine synthase A
MLLPDAAGAIGRTPLVELVRMRDVLGGRVFLKLELLNPGGSKKDRIALRMIDDALRDGRLRPGQPVVELTSGNTGTGLAIVCAARGLSFTAVMSTGNSAERRVMMAALGARVELVPQAPGSIPGQVSGEDLALVEARTRALSTSLGAFVPDQFRNPSNVRAHEEGTGPELTAAAGGAFDAFCDFVGSAGTFVGMARHLKPRGVRCYAVEPAGAAPLSGAKVTDPAHPIQGGGYALRPPLWEDGLADGFLTATGDEAIRWTRELARREGIFAGYSTGANLAGAAALLRSGRAKAVAALACDSGMKYVTTGLWTSNPELNS